jgi:chromosome segregation protein
MAQLKMEKQKLRDSLSQLRNPSLLAELQTLEQKRSEIENERITIRANLASLNAQKTTVHQPELENISKIFKQQAAEEIKFNKEHETLSAKRKENEALLKEKEKEAAAFYKQFQKLFDERNDLQEAMNKIEGKIIEEEDKVRKVEQQRGSINISLAGVRAEMAGIQEEYKQYEGVEIFKTKEQDDIEREIKQFERMMQDLGAINMKALEIYETVEKEYTDLLSKKTVLIKEREQVMILINEIETKKKEIFLKMFHIVNEQFKKIFQQLNTKGEAFLELENPEDPLTAGMNIKVRLSGTKFLDIRSLSGGEKTMTALAFLFAIQEHEPAQFYILDEVDAALDKRNAEKLAKLIRQYSEKVQYIMISHNDVVITEADNLYGVSMNEHGESKVTSLRV